MSELDVKGDFITLGQLLKAAGAIATGGDVRAYLSEHRVLVNGELELRRGRKLRPGDSVELPSGERILLT